MCLLTLFETESKRKIKRAAGDLAWLCSCREQLSCWETPGERKDTLNDSAVIVKETRVWGPHGQTQCPLRHVILTKQHTYEQINAQIEGMMAWLREERVQVSDAGRYNKFYFTSPIRKNISSSRIYVTAGNRNSLFNANFKELSLLYHHLWLKTSQVTHVTIVPRE